MSCVGSRSLPKQRRSLPDGSEFPVMESLLGSLAPMLDNARLHQ